MNTALLDKTLTRIEADLQTINSRYGLITSDLQPVLIKDIKYLLLDNIAKGIKLVFYNPDSDGQILFEYVYTLDDLDRSPREEKSLEDFSTDISFDIFIEFTDEFLSLDKKIQTLILQNTEFEWYPYS